MVEFQRRPRTHERTQTTWSTSFIQLVGFFFLAFHHNRNNPNGLVQGSMNHWWVRRSLQTTCDVKIGMWGFWSWLLLVPPISVIPGSLFGSIDLVVGGFSALRSLPSWRNGEEGTHAHTHTRRNTHTLTHTGPDADNCCGAAGTLLGPIGLKLFIDSTAPGYIYLSDFKISGCWTGWRGACARLRTSGIRNQ